VIRTMIGVVMASAAAMIPGPGYGGGGGRDHSPSKLTVSYLADAGFARAVKLECDPVGGGHPQAVAACAELATVGGDPSRIEPAHSACMMIYQPITAEVSGAWRGTAVDWKQRYGNSCEMKRALGALVAF
jgi:hypothetical protein